MDKRFVCVIENPGRVWTDYCVIDLQRYIVVCKCSDARDGETVAECLNLQWNASRAGAVEREQRLLLTP